MNIKKNIKKYYITKLVKVLEQNKSKKICNLYNLILKTWKKNQSIFTCGNAANANHITNDLSITAVKDSKRGLKVEFSGIKSLCNNM